MDRIGKAEPKAVCTMDKMRSAANNRETVAFHGSVYRLRRMGEIDFIVVRTVEGLVQCVRSGEAAYGAMADLREEACAEFIGTAHRESRAPGGFEIELNGINILSLPAEHMPIIVNKFGKSGASLDTRLNCRPASLRSERERAKFRIMDGITRAFGEYLRGLSFTEIHTPKTVAASAEGGANVFKLKYFDRKAFLAQSPQFYKQMMACVYERVFEIGPVFRAEKHSTARHLNEYTSLDFEMGYIDSFYDLMEVETGFLRYAFELLRRDYAREIETLKVKIPEIEDIPAVPFAVAKELAAKKYGRQIRDPNDLEPEEEQLIGRYFAEEYGSELVFVTHYPSKKRPFYAMDDPSDPKVTMSFDLLFRGMEVTTGGQRIHDYERQRQKLVAKGLDPEDFESYLMLHKYGAPPHGGLGIGLERLLMRLMGEDNIREDSLFPRDMYRLEP